TAQVVIIDCITLLVSNILVRYADRGREQIDASLMEEEVTSEIGELTECINRLDASFIIVTNEVGTGLVPTNKMGRLYRDVLGKANQLLAQQADEVHLMVSGLAVKIKPAS
ncbi:bifunctional adenosylcobinamide kinase/adenosylcobinamide-phosphate guanylyltransferase, partial [Chloroflexota bacterium]